jgi:hypothetical protein
MHTQPKRLPAFRATTGNQPAKVVGATWAGHVALAEEFDEPVIIIPVAGNRLVILDWLLRHFVSPSEHGLKGSPKSIRVCQSGHRFLR